LPTEEWQPGEILLKNKRAWRIENGYVYLPEFPGLGLDVDEAALKEFRRA
jgi:L-alanine-DL-glutamate epimerase-like enolase superfamily enzyme